jgi:hypothetical protein
MWPVLDAVGFLCALVLFLTALRLVEVSEEFEFSVRSLVAFVIGGGAAWSMSAAIEPGYLHPAHVLVLVGGALWVAQALYRHRGSPVRHPGRRNTDLGELDSLASGKKP